MCIGNIGDHQAYCQRFEDCAALLDVAHARAVSAFGAKSPRTIPIMLMQAELISVSRGAHHLTITILEDAWNILEQVHHSQPHTDMIPVYLYLAYECLCQDPQGAAGKAQNFLSHLLELSHNVPSPDVAHALVLLSSCATLLDEHERALEYLYMARDCLLLLAMPRRRPASVLVAAPTSARGRILASAPTTPVARSPDDHDNHDGDDQGVSPDGPVSPLRSPVRSPYYEPLVAQHLARTKKSFANLAPAAVGSGKISARNFGSAPTTPTAAATGASSGTDGMMAADADPTLTLEHVPVVPAIIFVIFFVLC